MIIPFGFLKKSSSASIYDDASVIYSLHLPTGLTWDNAVLKVRRDSDNATAFVFLDSSDEISLTSLTGSTNTSADGANLTTWVGANTAQVEEWIGTDGTNSITAAKTAKQTTTSKQPFIVSSGTLIVENGEVAIDNSTGQKFLASDVNTDLDNSNDFSIFSVSSLKDTSDIGGLVSSSTTSTTRFVLALDSRTQSRIVQVITTGTYAQNDYLTRNQITTQRLLSVFIDGTAKTATPYYQTNLQTDNGAWTGTYNNDKFYIGISFGSTVDAIDMTVQFIAVFPSNKVSEKTDLHADINTKFSIY